jgi:photosystem II stability/assembly factor-like uncharacterized protein
LPAFPGVGNDFYAAFCHSAAEVTIAGSGGMILRTTNSGSTWEIQTTGVSVNLLSMDFPVDRSTGYVVGEGGTILKTTNGGQLWVQESTGTTRSLNAVCFPQGNSTGYAGGGWGTILRTTNGGQVWDSVYGTSEDLYGLSFGTTSIGFAVGGYGTVVKTTDAGNTWSESSVGEDDLMGVCFPAGGLVGYAVGCDWWSDGATVWKTVDGGGNWARQLRIPNDEGLWSVSFIDNNIGYTVGGYGMILKTVDGGGIGISEENGKPTSPGQRSVALRCSPNPFSSRTGISLSAPLAGARTASLGIVDASGRHVRTLLVEPGIRSMRWDGTDDSGRRLPTGVYFCRLVAGDDRATCKLLMTE